MMELLGAAVIVAVAGYWIARLGRWTAGQWFLGVAWRFLSGHRRDTPPGRGRRAAWRAGGTLGAILLVAGWMADPQVTMAVAAGIAMAGLIVAAVLAVRWGGRSGEHTSEL